MILLLLVILKKLSEKYVGDHNLIIVGGDHNSERPQFYYDSVSIFFSNNLLLESDFEDNPIIEEEVENVQEFGVRAGFSKGMYNIGNSGFSGFNSDMGDIGEDIDEFEYAKQLSLMENKQSNDVVVEEEEDFDEEIRLAIELSKRDMESNKDQEKTSRRRCRSR